MDVDIRGIVVGFVAAAVVLAALVWFVGVDEIVATFALLDARYVALIALVGLLWLLAWAMALRTVLAALGVHARAVPSFLLFAASTFANNVTPFGQAGGEPFSALVIARATGSEYERSLAAVASVDSLNFVPSIALALVGLVYYLAVFTVRDGVLSILALVVALAIGVPVAAWFLWQRREAVESGLAGVIVFVLRPFGRVIPRFRSIRREAVKHRVAAFFHSIERVASNRRKLLVALSFSALGWLLMCLALWLSLFALGDAVPVAAVLIAVPVGTIASVTPLPGGLGGVEFALVLLIVPTTGVSPATAGAAALIYRGATYWLPTVVGAGALASLQGLSVTDRRRRL